MLLQVPFWITTGDRKHLTLQISVKVTHSSLGHSAFGGQVGKGKANREVQSAGVRTSGKGVAEQGKRPGVKGLGRPGGT